MLDEDNALELALVAMREHVQRLERDVLHYIAENRRLNQELQRLTEELKGEEDV